MRVSSIHIYPVKAMRAFDVDRAPLEPRGFAGDRRWLVVDSEGMFLTQRSHPRLATIAASPHADGLGLSAGGASGLRVATPDGTKRRTIVVWDAEVDAADAGDKSAAWLSDYLGEPSRLVFMDDDARRMKTSVWTAAPVPVSFADAFPVLVANAASLTALNDDIVAHGGDAIPMRRFRPNIVVDCDEPWAEDRWTRLKIGETILDLVKPSDRCIVTTTDQTTGERMGKEPLAALARLRRSTDPRINGVLFAVNAVPSVCGEIRRGDAIEVMA